MIAPAPSLASIAAAAAPSRARGVTRAAALFGWCCWLLLAGAVGAASAAEIRYTLRFPQAANGYVEVEASYPTGGAADLTVMVPVWTPGSYLVREYARHVEQVQAATPDGVALTVAKTRKNRWQLATQGAERVTLRYRVYGHELRTQTTFIDADFALLAPAATFLVPVDQLAAPIDVAVELPAGWSRVLSGMPSPGAGHFHADDYDQLVDSPIVAGNPSVHEFAVAGTPHLLVDVGGEQQWDAKKAVADVQRIVEQHRQLWGSLPYDRYLFFNCIVDAGGGTEHRNSAVLLARRFAMRTRKAYVDWLSLVSHEHFHTWNVKRLRPLELGPFDYENERYTPSLWVAEGFTDYYGDLQLVRAGLISRKEYLSELSKAIDGLQTTPGRLVTPLADASYDAWIKLYRPDENTPNSAISYYVKGSVVGFLLDAGIRRESGGARSLDDVMRTAYSRFSGARGYTPEDFLGVVREVGGAELGTWLQRVTTTTAELDYGEALGWLGLEREKPKPPTADEPAKAWTGLTVDDADGRVAATRVLRGSPADEAGLTAGDEIVAVDDVRLLAGQWPGRLEQYRVGDRAALLIARRNLMRTVTITLAAEPHKWQLEVVKKPTRAQRRHLQQWLGAGAADPAAAD
ncbi:MAG TPA: PDZ domain-containing protein [Thermoanaerobaculia bacterium]|nr:PDZ domain-containing protein [Thermoanaerobaculia bacterium]